MANIGHVDARELAADEVDQGELNAKLAADIAANKVVIDKINSDYVTSKNIGTTFRSSLPIHHPNTVAVNYDDIEFGDHTIWDFATGVTNAPPVPSPRWLFVEMIKTYPYPPEGSLVDNAIQRAWGYDDGFLATRSRYRNRWSPWRVVEIKPETKLPESMPEIPPEEPVTE